MGTYSSGLISINPGARCFHFSSVHQTKMINPLEIIKQLFHGFFPSNPPPSLKAPCTVLVVYDLQSLSLAVGESEGTAEGKHSHLFGNLIGNSEAELYKL